MTRGRFITFEGIDGAGKSTHLAWAERFLRARKVDLVVTREPGGTPLGESLRALLLGSATPVGPETEALLMFAARSQHIQEVILPALERGTWVLCDRFTDATFAYQGGGSGVPSRKLALLEAWVHPRLKPDLTVPHTCGACGTTRGASSGSTVARPCRTSRRISRGFS
jgi:dTMP kinase